MSKDVIVRSLDRLRYREIAVSGFDPVDYVFGNLLELLELVEMPLDQVLTPENIRMFCSSSGLMWIDENSHGVFLPDLLDTYKGLKDLNTLASLWVDIGFVYGICGLKDGLDKTRAVEKAPGLVEQYLEVKPMIETGSDWVLRDQVMAIMDERDIYYRYLATHDQGDMMDVVYRIYDDRVITYNSKLGRYIKKG